MNLKWYHYVGLGLAGIVAAPAIAAGGGLLLAGLAVVLILSIAFGAGPAWELYNNRRIGERGRSEFNIRDLMTPGEDGFDVERHRDRGGED
jgi:hypothetical protein